jgi:undecaprenyl-diphosphatase
MRLFRLINGGSDEFAPVMHFFSEAASRGWFRVVLGLLVIALVCAGPKTRRTAIQALVAFPIADAITNIIKHSIPEYRPYQELHDVVPHIVGNLPIYGTGVSDAANFGTASAHSANMAAVAFVFCYHLKWWGSPWVVIALLTGCSRIYLGAHYPYQVLLGWFCGVFAALVVCKTWDLWVQRKKGNGRTLECNEPA